MQSMIDHKRGGMGCFARIQLEMRIEIGIYSDALIT